MVTLRGRWSHAATTRIYVNDGLAKLTEISGTYQTLRYYYSKFVCMFCDIVPGLPNGDFDLLQGLQPNDGHGAHGAHHVRERRQAP